ncbi:class I histocompatibility antigen, F10 alpha chain-like [Protopterus annectens]|uniref:class I histocompatibility antigen, F10 alpha chain-like n=1 Tax=Protopterus annectens TaxID=7888 RepID=UPI001CFBE941|nr:class I histocompatibility antigen, F10 alpha chain-like [Protopterus annectens]
MSFLFAGRSHSLRYFYTGISGTSNFPEFVTTGYVDDVEIDRYDSVIQRDVPVAHWMKENEGQDYWDGQTETLKGWQQTFKANVKIVMDRTNQTTGIHSFQLMYGCSMNDGTTSGSNGFYQLGYDGQDFVTLDKGTMTWTAATPSAVITKNKWDPNTARNMQWKGYLDQTCIEWLQKYLKYGQTSLKRKVPPEAKMTDKTDGDNTKLKCTVSGFHPQDIDVYFVKDDDNKIETTTSTGLLPNSDGTYYTEKWIEIDPRDKYHYSCHTEHESLESKLIVKLDPESNVALIAGIVIAVVAVILIAIISVVIWKKKQKDDKHYTPANSK